MTTPPTAPPTIAPVDTLLCSADEELVPAGPDELGEGVLEELVDVVLPEDAGAF